MSEKSLDFEQSLEYQFLYNDDPNSIFILLSWLDNRNLYDNLIPKYSVGKALATGLRRSLGEREDKEAIIDAILRLIGDDLNRLELAFIIKAYRKGYYDSRKIDSLERLALNHFHPNELMDRKVLFHNSKSHEVKNFKDDLNKCICSHEDICNMEDYVTLFLEKNCKKKIFNVNYYINKQIVVDYSNLGMLRVEGQNLTIKELELIYNKVLYYVNRSLKTAYKNQYWYAINDAVLKRYI